MKSFVPVFLAAALLPCLPADAVADELLIEKINQQPANSPQGVLRPGRGKSMEQVRRRFGEPLEEIPRVGEPPITRWVYDKFTVYFEHQYVINSVVNR
jgi:hypothetical protein